MERSRLVSILLAPLAATLAGCSFISESGPGKSDIMQGAVLHGGKADDVPRQPYALVPMTVGVANMLVRDETLDLFDTALVDTQPATIQLGVGDILNISIFEAASGGLFVPADAGSRPGNFVQLPPQQIDEAGTINVPFGGRIKAVGLTPQGLQQAIQQRLAPRALEPQVIVGLSDRRAGAVSVVGDVTLSTRFTIDPGGERVLGALARANGPKFPAFETTITLQRGSVRQSALLSEIAASPKQNVQLQPGDTVIALHQPRYFLAFGATGNATNLGPINRRFPFTDKQISLADALALAGGLEDDRANPSAIFLYRHVGKQSLRGFGLSVPDGMPESIPAVFVTNLADPSGLFIASRVAMHAEDIIYVSNAPASDLEKFLSLAGEATGSISSARGTFR
jgi:polysaccharide export outer membrane protein